MVVRLLAQLRAPIFVGGQVAAWVLLAVDARREWNASWFVGLLLVLGALAAIPAQVVDQPEFRVVALVTQTIGAGVVALALYDTPDKRALWAYALAALGAVALPSSRPTLGALPRSVGPPRSAWRRRSCSPSAHRLRPWPGAAPSPR
ncbi:hypothetical protein [Verrucosispora sioxanthis]|uniref:hypothetical protein n=1 Tax=Verrucosispora sioxanthis TaxID=2499994 RepID=UPI001C0F4690|nr:hypothetical protein [Verrucosispora sioxanthis]